MKTDLSKIEIRKLTKEEIPILVDYRIEYLTELQGKNETANIAEVKSGLHNYFDKAFSDERCFAFIALQEKKILGFGAMIVKQIPGDFQQQTYLEGDILNMYTIPEARRKGISSLILEKLLNEAFSIGISKVALHTSKDGEKLYRKFGFSEPVYPYFELIINPENFKH